MAARTIRDLQGMKVRGEPIAMLTAYDYLFARIVEAAGVDAILVGDSLGQVVLGLDSTLPVSVDDMIHHAAAVCRGVERALVVVDMPFLSYQTSTRDAIRNAGRIMRETGAAAVKLEGGSARIVDTVRTLVEIGIPVMGHLGFTPQSVHGLSGARVQGRGEAAAAQLAEEAERLQEAGVFSVVLELVPGAVAERISRALSVPTVGIGAGVGCDGQVLVLPDMLGLNDGFEPRFLRRFAELGGVARAGIEEYVQAVKQREYPGSQHTFE